MTRRICSPVLFAILATVGCQSKERDKTPAKTQAPSTAAESSRIVPPLPVPLPGTRSDITALVGKAERAAIGDLDGDGRNEIIVAEAQRLRVLDASGKERASTSAPGGIQVLMVAQLDDDRRAEIVAGWGLGREHKQAPARVEIYRFDGERLVAETILTPKTPRNEITAIVPFTEERGTLLIAYFDTKYTVHSILARRGAAWSVSDVATIRMATSYARGDVDGDQRPDLVVGRIYGDEKVANGDAFVLRDDGTRIPMPTTRGVREVLIADGDGDGQPELFLADGWHQDYGRQGRGLLTWIHRVNGVLRSELIEDTPGQYSVGRIVASDVDGDGRVELVTVGSHYVRMFDRRSGQWEGLTLAGAARDVAIGDLDGIAGDEVLILGEQAEIVSLRELVLRRHMGLR